MADDLRRLRPLGMAEAVPGRAAAGARRREGRLGVLEVVSPPPFLTPWARCKCFVRSCLR